jgi:hypothetical protein
MVAPRETKFTHIITKVARLLCGNTQLARCTGLVEKKSRNWTRKERKEPFSYHSPGHEIATSVRHSGTTYLPRRVTLIHSIFFITQRTPDKKKKFDASPLLKQTASPLRSKKQTEDNVKETAS